MRLLLDTHVILWVLGDRPGLTDGAVEALSRPGNVALASAASAWEISIKRGLGKLHAPDDLTAALEETGLVLLPIDVGHAVLAGSLPPHHRDPFDRMLVAQAQIEGLTLVTRDVRLAAYDVPVLAA